MNDTPEPHLPLPPPTAPAGLPQLPQLDREPLPLLPAAAVVGPPLALPDGAPVPPHDPGRPFPSAERASGPFPLTLPTPVRQPLPQLPVPAMTVGLGAGALQAPGSPLAAPDGVQAAFPSLPTPGSAPGQPAALPSLPAPAARP